MPCIDTVQGFSFCQTAYKTRTSVYSGFYSVHAIYTTATQKPFTGLYSVFSVDLPYSSAHNTANTQAAYTPSAPRRTLYRAVQPPYYNKVYKGVADRRPCQPGGGSYSTCTGSARRLAVWHRVSSQGAPSTRRGSQVAGARRAARNHWRLAAASLFGLSPDSQ